MTGPAVRNVQAEVAEYCAAAGMKPDSPLRAALISTAHAADRLLATTEGDGVARLEQAAVRGADRRAAELARAHNWRTVALGSVALVGAFVLGVVVTLGGSYASAPAYQTVPLAGDAILCRASAAVQDASGARFYPALPVQAAPVAHR